MYLNEKSFTSQLSALLPDYREQKFLLAVSGGADSMVLAHLFLNLNLNFEIAHVNYNLRNGDSDNDQNLVERFCEKHSVKFHLKSISVNDNRPENSVQLWARKIRYDFFADIKKNQNLEFTVTGHHLNDELETFLINLSRASGLKGLSGIPRNQNGILRPLLKFSKEEIYRFAGDNQIEFREDLSNAKNDYLRNKIRNNVIPLLVEINDIFIEQFSKSIDHLNSANELLSDQIEEKIKSLSQNINGKIYFDKEKLKKESEFLKHEIFKKYGFDKPEEIAKLFTAENGSTLHSRDFEFLIRKNEIKIANRHVIKGVSETTTLPDEPIINLKKYLKYDHSETGNWKINRSNLKFPLLLRDVSRDDEIFPIGMNGKKKVVKMIKELKIPIFAKENIKVLSDSKNQVIGILPYRQDRRFLGENEAQTRIQILF